MQLPFWDNSRAFANLQKPVLYNLHTDRTESKNVVKELTELAVAVREDLGEFMQRGREQRPTGSLFPDVPVISHEKDWGKLEPATVKEIALERQKRQPNQSPKKHGPKRKKAAEMTGQFQTSFERPAK